MSLWVVRGCCVIAMVGKFSGKESDSLEREEDGRKEKEEDERKEIHKGGRESEREGEGREDRETEDTAITGVDDIIPNRISTILK